MTFFAFNIFKSSAQTAFTDFFKLLGVVSNLCEQKQ